MMYQQSNGGVMNHLQEVDYWVVSDQECQSAHGSNEVFSTNICGYYPGGGKGQCSVSINNNDILFNFQALVLLNLILYYLL
jgi:hypothetical protein